MKRVLLDTTALFALVDADDRDHPAVSAWLQKNAADIRPVVTDYVFDECMTLVKSRFGRTAIAFGQRIRDSKFCEFVCLSPQDEAATWQIFVRYADKAWSYTDCSCLAVMRRLGIQEVLSTDRHFRQMGVSVVP